jgi:hypothetical protein
MNKLTPEQLAEANEAAREAIATNLPNVVIPRPKSVGHVDGAKLARQVKTSRVLVLS